jgi:3'-5' exonuclease
MATLVFDIETTALPLENFDEAQQEYLFREADKLGDATARDARREEITKFMSLWPFTSQVVCIAMLNAETQRGQTIYVSDDFEDGQDEDPLAASKQPVSPKSDGGGSEDGVKFIPCADETELLAQFWEAAKNFNSVVTFNGRGFDVPFIYLRSALLNVPISKKNWLGYRYATEPHCDLAEQFTFYNVSGRDGAARRFNLDFYCKAFGIESPKSHGVTGMDVGALLAAGKFRDIAEYCLRDVRATVELYKIWKERLAGIK